eukprot:295587-Alexandrium_andersonii.AAC.1
MESLGASARPPTTCRRPSWTAPAPSPRSRRPPMALASPPSARRSWARTGSGLTAGLWSPSTQ